MLICERDGFGNPQGFELDAVQLSLWPEFRGYIFRSVCMESNVVDVFGYGSNSPTT